MSITESFLHSFNIDNRLFFFGTLAGITGGALINELASRRIRDSGGNSKEINSQLNYERAFEAMAMLSAKLAMMYQSGKLLAVSALSMAGACWAVHHIRAINSEQHIDFLIIQDKIDGAVTLKLGSLACMVAVPVAAFTWQVAQTMRKS